jgi:tetratricopeptide (TPR) repeat protein
MEELYLDFFKRIEIKNWEDILKSDFFLDAHAKTSIRAAMLHFLAGHPVLPKDVWVLMDREFGWTDNMSGMPAGSLADYAVLKEELDPRWDLDFTWFLMYKPSQDTEDPSPSVWTSARLKAEKEYRAAFPEYVKLRRDLRSAMYAGQYRLLSKLYHSAVLLFPDDPDIHRIYYEYFKRTGDIETPGLLYRFPEDVIRKLRKLCPDNPEYEAASADLLLRRGDYYKAADAYCKLVVRLPDHLDIAYHYGLVLKYLGADQMSRHVINGIRNHYQNAQTKLKKGESYLKDRVAIHYQMTRNDLVMQLYVGFPKEISPRKQQQRNYLIAAACIFIWVLAFFLVLVLIGNTLAG